MPWIKLDTSFYQHPKTAELLSQRGGPEAIIALQRMWCWAGGQDATQARAGKVSDAMCRQLHVTNRQAIMLSEAGFLQRNGTGWLIHDWDDHQGALIAKRDRDRRRRTNGDPE